MNRIQKNRIINLNIVLIILFFSINTKAQDTLVYSQKKSSLFSNKYYLFTKSKTFEHKYRTDDGQIWYGKGKYIIKKSKIIFEFGDTEREIKIQNRISKIYDYSKTKDTLTIIIVDINNLEYLGNIKYKEKHFLSRFDDGIIKIPKTEFENEKNAEIEFYLQGSMIKIKLNDLKHLNLIEIKAKDIDENYHFESNFDRILKYKQNRIISKDYYSTSRKKKVIFELINKG